MPPYRVNQPPRQHHCHVSSAMLVDTEKGLPFLPRDYLEVYATSARKPHDHVSNIHRVPRQGREDKDCHIIDFKPMGRCHVITYDIIIDCHVICFTAKQNPSRQP